MIESQFERKLVRWCRSQNILCLKNNANWYRNFPDRTIVLPGEPNIAFFLELKRPGEKPRPGQVNRLRRLRRMGYHAVYVDDLHEAIVVIQNVRYSQQE